MGCFYCSKDMKKMLGRECDKKYEEDIKMVLINGYFTAKDRINKGEVSPVYLKACPKCSAVYMFDL